MNCKYCGAALPSKGGVCPECGKMIPVSQMKEMQQMLDPRWNMYRNKDTAMYKRASNNDNVDNKIGKFVVLIILVIVVIIIIALVRGAS